MSGLGGLYAVRGGIAARRRARLMSRPTRPRASSVIRPGSGTLLGGPELIVSNSAALLAVAVALPVPLDRNPTITLPAGSEEPRFSMGPVPVAVPNVFVPRFAWNTQ